MFILVNICFDINRIYMINVKIRTYSFTNIAEMAILETFFGLEDEN